MALCKANRADTAKTIHFALAVIGAIGVWSLVSAAGPIAQPSGADLVKANLLIDRATIKAGEPFYAAVRLMVAPGWHIYWKNPGDAGVSTTVDWTLPAGWHAEELQYPTPRRFDSTGDIITYGYEDEVLLMARIVPDGAASGAQPTGKIGAKISYLVCKEECIPGEASAELSIPTGTDGDAVQPRTIRQWLDLVPKMTAEAQVASIEQKAMPMAAALDSFTAADVSLAIKWTAAKPSNIEFFPVPGDSLKLSNIRIADNDGQTQITFRVETLAGAKPTSPTFEGVVAYTPANGGEKSQQAVTIPIRLVEAGR